MIDDEETTVFYGRRILEKWGLKVVSSMKAKEALEKINKTKFDIALLDIHLEGKLNGLDVLNALHQKQPDCQCIMLTVDTDQGIIAKAKQLGAVEYLVKPMKLKDIDNAVNRAIKKARKEGK